MRAAADAPRTARPRGTFPMPRTSPPRSSSPRRVAYLQTFRLSGASFESADDETLNNWHERLNVTWRNIASPNVALWTHLIRRRESPHVASATGSDFADRLGAALPGAAVERDLDGE